MNINKVIKNLTFRHQSPNFYDILRPVSIDIIKSTTEKAVRRIKEFKPYKIEYPVQFEVSFKNYRPSEILDYLSIVERTDSHSIKFIGKDILEVSDFFTFIMTYSSDIDP